MTTTFFNRFPQTVYQGTTKVVNILTAFFLRRVTVNQSLLFQKMVIKDEDAPESLSYNLYKTTRHYWAFFLVNNIIDPYTDWIIRNSAIEDYVEKKYKDGIRFKKKDGSFKTLKCSSGIKGVHHFENLITGRVCDDVEDEYYREIYSQQPDNVGANIMPITNLAYENGKNSAKRQVFVINPRAIIKFEDDFSRVLVENEE